MPLEYSADAKIDSDPYFFSLKSTDGNIVNIDDVIMDNGLLICFICNHCPYVVKKMQDISREVIALKKIKIGSVAIMPNDVDAYPEDSFENMIDFKKKHKLECPYLIDETQVIARSYDAQCTPEFYLYFKKGKKSCHYKDISLKYRGRLCGKDIFERDLYNFAASLVENGFCENPQKQSFGCSIKWKNI